jgi:hypothetical protein
MHVSHVAMPTVDVLEPGEHSLQAVDAVTDVYEPMSQSAHCRLLMLNFPGLHAAHAVLPTLDV